MFADPRFYRLFRSLGEEVRLEKSKLAFENPDQRLQRHLRHAKRLPDEIVPAAQAGLDPDSGMSPCR